MCIIRLGGFEWDVDAAWDLVRDRVPCVLPVAPVDTTPPYTWPLGVRQDALETADLTIPVLVAMIEVQNGKFPFVLDGRDRVWAASVRGITSLPAHVLSVRESLDVMISGPEEFERLCARTYLPELDA